MEQNIERNIEKTISSIDDLQLIEAPPFFYTRLKARMEKGASPVGMGTKLRPALAMAGLALLIVLNVFTVMHLNKQTPPAAAKGQGSSPASIESFASLYGLNDNYSN